MKPPATGEASVLFSGGSDSTLTAAWMLERFSRVHLLTFRRMHLWFAENSELHLPLLRRKYGAERVLHVYPDCTAAFRRIFYEEFGNDLKVFTTHLAILVCLGCKMAMHACTIIYNLEHKIRCSAIGSREESKLYPDQTRPLKARIEQMYAEYGMEILSPVFELVDTDDIARDMGLTPRKDMKKQFLFYDSQPSCLYGGVAYVYSRCFYGPFFGDEVRERDALRYFDLKRPIVDEIVRGHFAAQGKRLEEVLADFRSGNAGISEAIR